MSMNVNFVAEREIQVVKTGKVEIQSEVWRGVWQTPTEVSYQIAESSDPFQAYREWVMDGQNDLQEPVYADNDVFHEGPIVGYETFNHGDEHLKDFDGWLKMAKEDGYEVIVDVW